MVAFGSSAVLAVPAFAVDAEDDPKDGPPGADPPTPNEGGAGRVPPAGGTV
jgi:hypothetical protein